MKKLIVFDCDGVLVDSEVIGCRIDAEALTEFGYPISTEEFVRRYTGMSDKTMAMRIKEDTGVEISEAYLEARLKLIVEAFERELKPLAHPLLNSLSRYNIARCVASGSQRSRVIRSLEITDQMKFFTEDSIFTAQQVEKGKPAPDLFLYAARRCGVEPEDCVVIEDSVAGIQAAQAANMDVIGFLEASHAQSDWYQDSVRSFRVPLAYSIDELVRCVSEYVPFSSVKGGMSG